MLSRDPHSQFSSLGDLCPDFFDSRLPSFIRLSLELRADGGGGSKVSNGRDSHARKLLLINSSDPSIAAEAIRSTLFQDSGCSDEVRQEAIAYVRRDPILGASVFERYLVSQRTRPPTTEVSVVSIQPKLYAVSVSMFQVGSYWYDGIRSDEAIAHFSGYYATKCAFTLLLLRMLGEHDPTLSIPEEWKINPRIDLEERCVQTGWSPPMYDTRDSDRNGGRRYSSYVIIPAGEGTALTGPLAHGHDAEVAEINASRIFLRKYGDDIGRPLGEVILSRSK